MFSPGIHSNRLPTTDDLAEEMMADLLNDRSFQKLWTDLLVEVLVSDIKSPSPAGPRLSSKQYRETSCTKINSLVDNSLAQLVDTIHLTVDIFLRGVRLSFCDNTTSGDLNREFSALYSIRVQLDRLLMTQEKDSSAQWRTKENVKKLTGNSEAAAGLIARRLVHLLKNFGVRISTPYSVKNHAFFASSICDLLYRFEEFCSTNVDSEECVHLRKTVNEFYSTLVKGLDELLLKQSKTRPRPSTNQEASASFNTPLSNTKRSKSLAKLCGSTKTAFILTPEPRLNIPANQKSFILPAHLETARRRTSYHKNGSRVCEQMNAGQIKRSGSAPCRKPSSARRLSTQNSKPTAAKRHRLNGALKIDAEVEKLALRQACEITREIMVELEQRIQTI
uniref:Uncharacterized protein n=1 Tax=Ditylenchus dipsaci TaxID=166011 RepID=A0A915DEQ7_9BILA